MARREQLHGRVIQDARLNQHGPLSAADLPGLQYWEPRSVLEMMESRAALQDADTQNLVIEDQRQLAGHKTLSQNIDNTEKEIQRIQADIEAVYGMQRSELLGKMEAERLAGDAMKKELLQKHLEIHKLRDENRELRVELQKRSEQLVKANKRSEVNKSFAELHTELDGLQKEYQSMRSEFEYSRDINTKQIEQMKTMEMSFIALTKQVDKLRADMQNAEMRAQSQFGTSQAQAPYGSAYNNLPAAYGQATRAGQSGLAQATTASAAIYPYAYFPADAYRQATHPWHYAYAMPYADAHPMARRQVVRGSGYAGYPGADYGQDDIPYYYWLP